jgi:hypothetical protein
MSYREENGGKICSPDQLMPVELVEWLRERYDNCIRIAAQKTGDDKEGWLDDAAYFRWAIETILGVNAS